LSFGELPEIMGPAQQPRLRLTLGGPYPVALRGKLVLSFTPDPGLVDDKSIQFITGGRSVEFQIPENSTEPVMPVAELALQTGTVAGTIDIAAQLFTGDLEVTPTPVPSRRIRIDRTAPVVSSVRVNRTGNGFEVIISGFSTTREVTSATFSFTTAPGFRLD